MYIVLTYDVAQERVAKVCRYLRRYLHWVQNSVFEGEITEGRYAELLAGLRKIIRSDYDSIYIFHWPAAHLVQKTSLGQERGHTDWLIE
ncbi:MAG: CRISPR-associated endonuclease Cas2 [Bacteroidia bacterium]|nr:CRISPR-associated endonuclease Cas2 [Bacteroidia bacterium]